MNNIREKYARDIFNIEMHLREVAAFIFVDTYKEDFYNLLKEINVKISGKKGEGLNEQYFIAYFENQFFHLEFSQYLRLNTPKGLKLEDLEDIIVNTENYDEFKKNIQSRGIINKKYQDFLAEIEGNLDPIKKFRDCIAHNRSFNRDTEDSYNKAKEKLKRAIEDFWKNMTNL